MAVFFRQARKQIILVSVLFLLMFHFTSAVWVKPNEVIFRHIHLAFMLIIMIAKRPFLLHRPNSIIVNIIDFLEIGFMLYAVYYVGNDLNQFQMRAGSMTRTDVIMGTLYIIILMDAGRRTVGFIMVGLAFLFVVQNLVADKLAGIFYGPPVRYTLMIDYLWVRSNGIFSDPVTTISSYVVFFLIFAALLNESGAGTFFIDFAQAIAGRARGGPAKTAVVASSCFGTISGSPISNVVGTGSITIPMMKKLGYPAVFAGAVEAVASSGGAIMPPMMGAASFIIASTLGIRYIDLALYAMIPALLYYLALYFQVDFRAAKLGLTGLDADKLPRIKETLARGGQLFLPVICIVVLLAMGRSPQYGALMSTLMLILLTFVKKWTRLSGRRLMKGMFEGIMDTSTVSVTAGIAGLIIGGLSISGLGLLFTQQIYQFSMGQTWLALILVAVASLVLGMGMTTVAVYITVATLMAPALARMGIQPLAAHMFVFYFGCVGTITPPVAMSAYAAASISGASPASTGWTAFRLGAAGYIVPFMFVYGPSLLWQGQTLEILWTFATAILGIWMLAGCFEGWLFRRAGIGERILMGIAAILTIKPGIQTDMVGLILAGIVLAMQLLVRNKVADKRAAEANTKEIRNG